MLPPEVLRSLQALDTCSVSNAIELLGDRLRNEGFTRPAIRRVTTAAAHAPDTVTAAVGVTTSGATAGLSMAAIGGAMVLVPTSPGSLVSAAPAFETVYPDAVQEILPAETTAQTPAVAETAPPAPAVAASKVVAVNFERVSTTHNTMAAAPTTTAAPAQVQAAAAQVEAAGAPGETLTVHTDSKEGDGKAGQDEDKAKANAGNGHQKGGKKQGSGGPQKRGGKKSSHSSAGSDD